jgi:hypothetical protein
MTFSSMMRRTMVTLVFVATMSVAHAQATSKFAGDWQGVLELKGATRHLTLHLVAGANGTVSGTIDSPDQGALGVGLSEVKVQSDELDFAIAMAHGSYTGKISADGTAIAGTYKQGASAPLTFTRVVSAATAVKIDGDWQGMLEANGSTRHLTLHLVTAADGSLSGTIDSPDQGALGVGLSELSLKDGEFKFTIAMVNGTYKGKLSSDGSAMTGIYTHAGADTTLDFARVAAKPAAATP